MEKAVCYIKVPAEEKGEKRVFMATLEEKLLAYCKLAGLMPVAVICEDENAVTMPLTTRPGGEKLLRLVNAGKVKHVVVFKFEWLFCDAEDALSHVRDWDKTGVTLHLVEMKALAVKL